MTRRAIQSLTFALFATCCPFIHTHTQTQTDDATRLLSLPSLKNGATRLPEKCNYKPEDKQSELNQTSSFGFVATLLEFKFLLFVSINHRLQSFAKLVAFIFVLFLFITIFVSFFVYIQVANSANMLPFSINVIRCPQCPKHWMCAKALCNTLKVWVVNISTFLCLYLVTCVLDTLAASSSLRCFYFHDLDCIFYFIFFCSCQPC